jgi:hypothetical protein
MKEPAASKQKQRTKQLGGVREARRKTRTENMKKKRGDFFFWKRGRVRKGQKDTRKSPLSLVIGRKQKGRKGRQQEAQKTFHVGGPGEVMIQVLLPISCQSPLSKPAPYAADVTGIGPDAVDTPFQKKKNPVRT